MSETPIKHGTPGAYTNRKCRCKVCRKAWSKHVKEERDRRSKSKVPAHVHGTLNGYVNYRCRCIQCKSAVSSYTSERRLVKA